MAVEPTVTFHDRADRRKRPVAATIMVRAAATWLVVIAGLAIVVQWLPIAAFDDPVFDAVRQGPHFGWPEPLGTDALGQSMLSRLIYGARISLAVGFLSVGFGLVLGLLLGIVAGYFGGWVDAAIGVLTDTLLSIPPLILLLVITMTLSPSIRNMVIGLGLLGLPTFLRIARANTLSVVNREYVAASAILGARKPRILIGEILPNVITPVLAFSLEMVGVFIVAEASLSFLGLGVPPPQPSWGGMIADGSSDMEAHLHLIAEPVLFMVLTVLSLKVVGDRLREKFDTRESAL